MGCGSPWPRPGRRILAGLGWALAKAEPRDVRARGRAAGILAGRALGLPEAGLRGPWLGRGLAEAGGGAGPSLRRGAGGRRAAGFPVAAVTARAGPAAPARL